MKIIITCEHGGNILPEAYETLLCIDPIVLESHEGWDGGALTVAKFLAKNISDFFYYSETSRLLVDLNRSIRHPNLFSSFSKNLTSENKNLILKQYYFPYRHQVLETIQSIVDRKETAFHLSVHSFTPIFKGEIRPFDIGLLYDPKANEEKAFCHQWKQHLKEEDPFLKVRYNQPYLGIADGLVTSLRKKFPSRYIGIELEMNQKITLYPDKRDELKKFILHAFKKTLITFFS